VVRPWAGLLSDFCRALGGLNGESRRTALRAAVAAAIFGQIANEPIHYGEVGRVNELTAFAALCNESGALKILQVECQRGWQEPDALTDHARRQSVGTALNE
jgi:hypothetical protein